MADFMRKVLAIACVLLFLVAPFGIRVSLSAEDIPLDAPLQDNQETKEPIVVNGNKVEYSTNSQEVTATGNVVVTYKGSILTCDKLTVNTATKEGKAEGHARLDDPKGVIEGESLNYNFQNKTGIIADAQFRADPYFGRAQKIDKISEAEFIGYRSKMSTCSFDQPHYLIKSKKVDFIRGDKVMTKNNTFLVGKIPVMYLPRYNHSLKDPMMHVQFMPGKHKDWGQYLLTATRFSLTDRIRGRIYSDYRVRLGAAEGFGANYDFPNLGKGDLKYYYTQERPKRLAEGTPAEFQRYFIRWRHKWEIDENTNFTSEYYKITDSKREVLGSQHNFLKDYFYREYEKDSQPLSYALFHHSFNRSSMDVMLQKRTNRWYTQLEKLPEINYSLPSLQIGETPFYLENYAQFANYNYKHAVPSAASDDTSLLRFDTTNKISLPTRVSFIRLTPFAMNRETFYDANVYGSSIAPRTIFYAGTDASTKFYRVFNVKSNLLGMDINGLRHIITPTITYSYNHRPTILSSKLKQIDSIDALARNNSAALELSNKLQTKRNNKSVDFVDFRINSTYTFKPKSGDKRGSSLSDILLYLNFLPNSWIRLDADATYSHYKDYFSDAHADINFSLGKERWIGFGERYQRKGSKEFTFDSEWRVNPKWKFGIYERYNFAKVPNYTSGLREQQYTISRDLHCWAFEVTYNVERGKGETIWCVFRLKAFPEIEFNFDQNYHQPKPGSQTNLE